MVEYISPLNVLHGYVLTIVVACAKYYYYVKI